MGDPVMSNGSEILVGLTEGAPAAVKVALLVSIDDPGSEAEMAELKTLEGTFVLPSGDETPSKLSGELFCEADDPAANYRVLKGLKGKLRNWKVAWNDGEDDEFEGTLTKLSKAAAAGDGLKSKFEIAKKTADTVEEEPEDP